LKWGDDARQIRPNRHEVALDRNASGISLLLPAIVPVVSNRSGLREKYRPAQFNGQVDIEPWVTLESQNDSNLLRYASLLRGPILDRIYRAFEL
jgi:hypothetical protein